MVEPNSLSELIASTQATPQTAAPAAATNSSAIPIQQGKTDAVDDPAMLAEVERLAAGTPAIDASTTPSVDAATTSAPTAGETPATAATPAPTPIDFGTAFPALQAKAAEVLGVTPEWLNKYKSVDELIRGVNEQQALIGRQAEAMSALRWMQEHGITAQDIQALASQKLNPQAPQLPIDTGWRAEYLAGVDDKGQPQFAATAPADAAQRYAKWQGQLREAAADPTKWSKFIADSVQQQLAAVQQQTAQTLQQQQAAAQAAAQQQQAQQQHREAAAHWAKTNAKDLFLNKTDESGGYTPMGVAINTMLQTNPVLANSSAPLHEKLEYAKQFVLAQATPKPPTATPPAQAGRQAAPNVAPPRPLNETEFNKKYPDAGLADFLNYMSKGIAPKA
jgi:hypothetical protein